MTVKKNRIITITLALLFLVSFVLPALQGPMGIKLNGVTVFGAQLATIVFIEGLSEYILFLFVALTNIWVVLLLVWSLRKSVKFIPTIIVSVLALSSALTWVFRMEQGSVLLVGYWLWLLSIIMTICLALYRSLLKGTV